MYLVVFRVFVSTILIFKMTNAELVLYQRSHDDSVDYVLKAVDEKLLGWYTFYIHLHLMIDERKTSFT